MTFLWTYFLWPNSRAEVTHRIISGQVTTWRYQVGRLKWSMYVDPIIWVVATQKGAPSYIVVWGISRWWQLQTFFVMFIPTYLGVSWYPIWRSYFSNVLKLNHHRVMMGQGSLTQTASQLHFGHWGAMLPPLRCTSWKAHLLRGFLASYILSSFLLVLRNGGWNCGE